MNPLFKRHVLTRRPHSNVFRGRHQSKLRFETQSVAIFKFCRDARDLFYLHVLTAYCRRCVLCNAGSISEGRDWSDSSECHLSFFAPPTEGAIAIWELGEYGPFERYRARDSAGRLACTCAPRAHLKTCTFFDFDSQRGRSSSSALDFVRPVPVAVVVVGSSHVCNLSAAQDARARFSSRKV